MMCQGAKVLYWKEPKLYYSNTGQHLYFFPLAAQYVKQANLLFI